MKRIATVLLLVTLLLVIGCTGAPITISTSSLQPSIVSFNADPSSISAGQTANISWSVTGATTVSIDQGIGNVALTGTRAVTPAATTVYTLMASNSAGTATATTQVIVAGAATPTPTPTPTGLPVISYFMASPSIITTGSSTTLSWSVSNATSVSIDNGIGSVAPTSSTAVSPPSSTNYTLTAMNAVGLSYVTASVLVGSAIPSGIPDLVITDITNASGTINYTIMNQGDAVAGPTTSTLKIDGATIANDNVGSLAPGQSKTESFAGYAYSCTLPGDELVVSADTGNSVVESSEANNSFTKSWSCLIIGPMYTVKFPDLVIQDVWKVSEITGDKIYYRIKNQGDKDITITTTSYLYKYPCATPCMPVATDPVLPLAAGASRVEKFASYNFIPGGGSLCSVTVKADPNGDLVEKDETNNNRNESCTGL